jgi:hypothetical protein
MLQDPRAEVMLRDLARQWLQTDEVDAATPDATLFRTFDAPLRAALKAEAQLFLAAFFKENRSLLEMLDADFTFLNSRLARHYGVAGVAASQQALTKVELQGNPQRGGLLTLGDVHVITARSPRDTSIEVRGSWVMDHFLCTEIPEAPEGAVERQPKPAGASKRERAEARNAMVSECGFCHRNFDGIGFALESYDVTGAWQTHLDSRPIDVRGELEGLGAFNGPKELSAALKKDPRFPLCLTRALATYLLGRLVGSADDCTLRGILDQAAGTGYRVEDVMRALVGSTPFRFQSGEAN